MNNADNLTTASSPGNKRGTSWRGPILNTGTARTVQEIRNHYHKLAPHVQYAVTLQTKLIPHHDALRAEQQRISLQEDFWHFRRRINYGVFGKASHRKPDRYSLLILPVIEGLRFSPAGLRTIHHHLGVGNVPADITNGEFGSLVCDAWRKTRYGQDDINITPADPGWIIYITKELEQGHIDCVDWPNACVPHEALHI